MKDLTERIEKLTAALAAEKKKQVVARNALRRILRKWRKDPRDG